MSKRVLFIVGGVVVIGLIVLAAGSGIVQSAAVSNVLAFVGFRTPQTSNYVGESNGFRTPRTSNYVPAVPTPGWRTPQTSNYKTNNGVGEPGWRTPPTSQHYPPAIPTPGWRTPSTSNYSP